MLKSKLTTESIPPPPPIEVPEDTLKKWQKIVDLIATLIDIPAALITRLLEPDIEIFRFKPE